MKIFLTGGTGVIGHRALPALVGAGHAVTAVARNSEKAGLVRSLGGVPLSVDLFDPAAVTAAVADHDAVVNLATNIPPLSKATRASAWVTNERLRTEASRNLTDAARETGATRYVQESICFAYADQSDHWISEDSPVTHIGPFAGAGQAEAVTAELAEETGVGVVLRFAQFYALGANHTLSFNKLARWHINPFVGDPDSYVSFIHAEDAATAVVAALGVAPGVYNISDDEPLTRAEAGRAVADALGVKRLHALPRLSASLGALVDEAAHAIPPRLEPTFP